MGERVVLNIRGVQFETFEETLSRFPNTLLGSWNSRKEYWNIEKSEYYFDRSQHMFDTILFFYQSGGILAKPDCFEEDEFQDELRFFGIIKDQPEAHLAQKDGFELRHFLWLLTEHPKSSNASKLFSAFSILVIIVSTITYCLQTEIDDLFLWNHSHKRPTINGMIEQSNSFFIFETFYAGWFILEYLLRIAGNPARIRFLFSPLGLVDLLSIIPYLFIASGLLGESEAAIRTFKFLQIFRILKLSRYSKSLQLLWRSLYYCKGQISLLLIFFFINCLACGSVLYWVERTLRPASNNSLMDAIWFCIVSMTTVGYGDVVPRTSLGKIVGAITILVGIIVLFHIFIPVYLSYFALLYEISVLKSLEQSECTKELECQEPDDFKKHRRKSMSSSVRRPQSMPRTSSVCVTELTPVGRKTSVPTKEDTALRRIKYDYLRKMSSTDSPLTMSQRSLEIPITDVPLHQRKGSYHKRILDSPNEIHEKSDYVFSYLQKSVDHVPEPEAQNKQTTRNRRQAVYEQPILLEDAVMEQGTPGKTRMSSSFRIKRPPLEWSEKLRKFSLGENKSNLKIGERKTISLQHLYRKDPEGFCQ